jgi:endonuclease/exonuclease/phosphatase (EEP) superfamily protein YafD
MVLQLHFFRKAYLHRRLRRRGKTRCIKSLHPNDLSKTLSPAFVVGDLNITPFAAPFRAFINHSGLRDSRAGRGILATWPGFWPSIARIPIDYILHYRHLRTLALKTGRHHGSDHLLMLGEYMFVQ